MREYGLERTDFGKLCVAQRRNAMHNPLALLRKPLSLEDYLNARLIAEPLRLFDCVMPCAGADAFLVMSAERAASLELDSARVLGIVERHNACPEQSVQNRGIRPADRDQLWRQAALGPEDMRFLQAYDDYPVIALMQIEDLGFYTEGEGAAFIRSHEFDCGGDFPLNTSGGQLSMGQAGAAGGFLGLVEALRQLLRQPLGRQVQNASVGAVSGFGMINYGPRPVQRRRHPRPPLIRPFVLQDKACLSHSAHRTEWLLRQDLDGPTRDPPFPPESCASICFHAFCVYGGREMRKAVLITLAAFLLAGYGAAAKADEECIFTSPEGSSPLGVIDSAIYIPVWWGYALVSPPASVLSYAAETNDEDEDDRTPCLLAAATITIQPYWLRIRVQSAIELDIAATADS